MENVVGQNDRQTIKVVRQQTILTSHCLLTGRFLCPDKLYQLRESNYSTVPINVLSYVFELSKII